MGLRYRRSLAGRVILLTTMAVGLSVAIVAAAAYLTVRHQLSSSLDASLHKRAEYSAQVDPAKYSLSAIPGFMQHATDTVVGYISADGETTTTSDVLTRFGAPERAVAQGASTWSCRTMPVGHKDYRVATVPTVRPGVALVVAESLQSNDDTLDRLGLVLLVFGVAGMLAAALAGWGVAHSGLRPVRRLTAAAEEIARTEKLDPIEVEGKDEIARLASAFNAMLAALSASRDRQRQLVADAGHELRTPLTSLRTNLELLSQADRQGGLSEASRAELLDDVRFQIEELTQLIGDLTELAREQPAQVLLEEVDFAEVTERAVQRVRRRASSLHFDLAVEPWFVTGESSALERAVTNLLDNAAKWSPPLGRVSIELRHGTLMVADQGHGIPVEDLPHVFDRFYRSPESRTMPGSGLGLSIVRQVAERHGGTVRAGRSPDGGAAFWLTLPGAAVPGGSDPTGSGDVEHLGATSAASEAGAAGAAGSHSGITDSSQGSLSGS